MKRQLKYSLEFKEILNSISCNSISRELLKIEGRVFFNATIIKNCDDIGYLEIDKGNYIKIGRFIQNVLPNKYSDSEIEKFVNEFKSLQMSNYEIKLVSGDEINIWYKTSSHHEVEYGGSLSNSCMNNKNYFEIYTKNPEVCQMLILTFNGKLIARSLVWNINKNKLGIEYLMDKVYSQTDYHQNIMRTYADKLGWAYIKSSQNIIFKGKNINIYRDNIILNVKVKNIQYLKFPYMDTFRKYNYKKNILSTDDTSRISPRGHTLSSLKGEYKEELPCGFFTRVLDSILFRFNL